MVFSRLQLRIADGERLLNLPTPPPLGPLALAGEVVSWHQR